MNRNLCCARNCFNSPAKNPNLRFFRYPKKNDRLIKWLEITKKGVTRPRHVCEEHFEEDSFSSTILPPKSKLKWNAVPTLITSDRANADIFGEAASDVSMEEEENEMEKCRELISIVKQNPHLFNGTDPLFCNTNFKTLSWASVGQALSTPISGQEAETLFSKLTQKFRIVRNHVSRQSTLRSSASAKTLVHHPKWALYDDLMFLADFIQPRERTSSNYLRQGSKGVVQRRAPKLVSVEEMRASVKKWFEKSNTPTPLPQQSTQRFHQRASSSDDDNTFSNMSDVDSTTVHSTLRVLSDLSSQDLAKICEVSSDDDSTFSAQSDVDSSIIDKRLLFSTNDLSRQAHAVQAALENTSNGLEQPPASPMLATFASFSPGVQSLLGAVGFAITKVPDEQQLPCLIDILQLVNTKYCKRQ